MKTKIVCTIGPNSADAKTIEEMVKAGMNVARLNFSHGTHKEKGEQIDKIRIISKKLNIPVGIIADFQGPKIRFGDIAGEEGQPGNADPKVQLQTGQRLQFSINPTKDELPIQYDLSKFVKKGHRILLNDGSVSTVVEEVRGSAIKVKVLNNGWISSKKSINVPDTLIPNASFTDKDLSDAEFALSKGVDFVAVSFVQTTDDLKPIKELIKKQRSAAKIIVKLEKPQAVANLESIIKACDVVMVARGDLAVETSNQDVPIIQKRIVRLARQNFKPVIVATQMLKSMTDYPTPTRAEVSDVANAVFDQADGVMTSDETTIGQYPIETVKTMKAIISNVEQNPEYYRYIKIDWAHIDPEAIKHSAIVSAAASLSHRIAAKYIIVATSSGKTVQYLSAFRPDAQIIAAAQDINIANQLSVTWGVDTIVVPAQKASDKYWREIADKVKKLCNLKRNDKVVAVAGSKVGVSGATDTIKVITF